MPVAHKPPWERMLIVGAGPSGLLLSLLLAQQGISSTVLEAWPQLDTRLRATQYGVPATRIFKKVDGLLEDFRAASIPKFPSICWRRVADGEKLLEIDMSVVEDEEDRMVILQLGIIVQIMYRHAMEKFGPEGKVSKGLIEVKFNHKVTGTGQDADKAWVEVEETGGGGGGGEDEDEEKTSKKMEADYIIGCDGARSAVRRSLYGKTWPGQTFPCRFIVQNVFYPGFDAHNWDGGNYMVDKNHWGLIARRGHGGLWRVTYGDTAPNLSDEEYLARRPWHLKNMLPGSPEPGDYRIEDTNLYNIHNRCVDSFRVGRILLAADAAHVCNPMGGYGCMTAVLDTGALADCFIGLHRNLASESILQKYADIRREIFLKYIDARSIKNLDRVSKTDPWTVKDTDKFFATLKDVTKDKKTLKEFLLKTSSIEYDFTQFYDKVTTKTNGSADAQPSGSEITSMDV
ncbi:hypothetical protein D0859_16434 [Lecanosticta acicola]|uniref:FAD-binding domain-containing protein n=1 Tax=Lecanosticta acicola TaxID=111012 RepID=A0AAI9EAE7_9PEZI|nr:hypothetical protein D0859_16434 [Lecanosticta acicola]